MKISREDVLHVAELAHLEIPEGEVEKLRQQIDSILNYIDKLNELDTAKVEPMAQVLAGVSVPGMAAGVSAAGAGGSRTEGALGAAAEDNSALREDVPAPCGLGKEVVAGAPDPSPPYFRVPKVIDR